MYKIFNDTCTGCAACMNACPKKCITMELNKIGELTPKINAETCIDCGLCRRICPQNNPINAVIPKKCYVAWNKNNELRNIAASGGFAVGVAEFAIKNGYTVYGCDYNSDMDLVFFPVKNIEDIKKIAGSKYSQANAGYLYNTIKQELTNGRKIILIGTPCQIAGLKAVMHGENNDNLITIDLICHGTPPNEYLKEYICSVVKDIKDCNVKFRGEYQQYLSIFKDSKLLYKKYHTFDSYYTAFYKNIISRNSCYTCKYAQNKRISDITIGDFWGLGELKKVKKPSQWSSIVLLNTQKGLSFFDKIKDGFIYEERAVDEGIKGNGRLNNPPGKSSDAEKFQELYEKYGFVEALRIIRINREVFINKHFGKIISFGKKVKLFIQRVINVIKRRL